jgi:hypothetical protein
MEQERLYEMLMPGTGNSSGTPHAPCISYTKVPNQYGPYAYCSWDKAVDTQAQKEKIAW